MNNNYITKAPIMPKIQVEAPTLGESLHKEENRTPPTPDII